MMPSEDPEVFGKIWVDWGAITTSGVEPGSATKALIMTPNQLIRLLDLLGEAALKALCVAIEEGALRLDPPRIEVPRWSRDWLMARGWQEGPARRAVASLKKAGFIHKVYGERGAAGGALAVVNASRFTWPTAVGEVISEASGRPRLVIAGQGGADLPPTRLGASRPNAQTAPLGPVDNVVHTFGGLGTDRVLTEGRLGAGRPVDQSPESLVSAIGPEGAVRDSTPPTSKEVVQEEVLLSAHPGEAAPLTRASLHRFLGETRLREALAQREAQSISALAALFARNLDSTRSALEFLDRVCGEQPEIDLAWFVFDLLMVDAAHIGDVAAQLGATLRNKDARLPKMPNEDLIRGIIVTLAVAQDSVPKAWPAYIVWALGRTEWSNSKGLSALVSALNGVVFSPIDAPSLPESDNDEPSRSLGADPDVESKPGGDLMSTSASDPPLRAKLPSRGPSTSADPQSPSAEEMEARGDAYWQWLRNEVVRDTDFDDDVSFGVVRRNRKMQDRLIAAHRRRTEQAE